MALPSRQAGIDTDAEVRDKEWFSDVIGDVSMHSTNPERSVFIEEDNSDGWISTDVTVDLER